MTSYKTLNEFKTIEKIKDYDLCYYYDSRDMPLDYHKDIRGSDDLYFFKAVIDDGQKSLLPSLFNKNSNYVKNSLVVKNDSEYEGENLFFKNMIYAIGSDINKPVSFIALTASSSFF